MKLNHSVLSGSDGERLWSSYVHWCIPKHNTCNASLGLTLYIQVFFNSIQVYLYSAFHYANRCKAALQKIEVSTLYLVVLCSIHRYDDVSSQRFDDTSIDTAVSVSISRHVRSSGPRLILIQEHSFKRSRKV